MGMLIKVNGKWGLDRNAMRIELAKANSRNLEDIKTVLYDEIISNSEFVNEIISSLYTNGYFSYSFDYAVEEYDTLRNFIVNEKDIIDFMNSKKSELSIIQTKQLSVLLKNHCINEKRKILNNYAYARRLTNSFTLNEKFKNSIINSVPESFDLLQKVYFIYRRLCQIYSYDEEYFFYQSMGNYKGVKEPTRNYSSYDIFNDIDPGSDLICTIVTLILCKFLDHYNIYYNVLGYNNNPVMSLGYNHMKARLMIGDDIIDADAAHGLLASDLSIEKSYGTVHSFGPIISTLKTQQDLIAKQLSVVDDYIKEEKEKLEFKDAVNIYESEYRNRNTITVEDKVELLCDFIIQSQLKFFDIFYLVNQIYADLFKKPGECAIEFIINARPTQPNKRYELALLIAYNEEGKVGKDIMHNNYLLLYADGTKEHLSYHTLYSRFRRGILNYTSTKRNFLGIKGKDRKERKGARK